MKVAGLFLAWATAVAALGSSGNSWLDSDVKKRTDDIAQLNQRLSKGATIYLPGSDGFNEATTRWSVLSTPKPTVIVVPATANDVSETVKFANQFDIPFLATNGRHGAITTQGDMKWGIQIWLDKLNKVEISKDGKSVKIGGGTLSKKVTDTLWAANKQTVTGGCECTSILGPGLGGGHGFLQGRFGLIADQFISMDVVYADGGLRTIDKNSDIWWAMQGAGHNFGIVTSVTSKIYDVKYPDWAYQSFIFTGDKVEELYTRINNVLLKNGTQPVDVMNYSFFFNNAEVDPENPVIMFFILQEGVTKVDSVWTDPFVELGPVVTDAQGGIYPDLPAWTGNGNESPPCQKAGYVNIRFPIDLQVYSISAQRQAYDLFAKGMKENPEFVNSLFLFEGYSLQGMKAVERESTAFPFRDDNLLIAPLIIYEPNGDALNKKARDLGEGLRNILYKGSQREELHTYVNYAFGKETKNNWYGYERWRQQKLTTLKKKYDPKNKFRFYAPIA